MREWTENRGRKTRQEAVGESPRSGRESQDRDTGKGYRKDRLKRHFEGKINRIWYLNQETNQRPFLTLDTGLKGKKTANTEKFKWESRFRRCVGNPPNPQIALRSGDPLGEITGLSTEHITFSHD